LGLLIVVAASGCRSSGPSPSDDIVRVAIPSAPVSFDPRVGSDEPSQWVHQLVYDSLPALADAIENPDPLSYVVRLRHGVRFHDGHELTAKDVVYTLGRSLDPTVASALDDHTVAFTLTEPDGAFPRRLAVSVVPDGAGEVLRTFPIGTGPYRFARYVVDEQVELTAFEGYWDGLPQNAGITLLIIPDGATRARELRNGRVDLVVDHASVAARPDLRNVRLTPGASFSTLKDVKKVAPYGPDFTGPSDAGRY
jgi:peptide/nickel transport system substrate-binding protein